MRVLDHFYLRLRNDCLFVTVGNIHTDFFTVGFVKYCPGTISSLWSDSIASYNRIVKWYEIKEVYDSTPWRIHVPFYGTEVPVVGDHLVKKIYDPLVRASELKYRTSDSLEVIAVSVISELEAGTSLINKIGVTGSLLPRIHHPDVSDIDLVVYSSKASADIVEYVSANPGVFKPLPDAARREWARRVAEKIGLSMRQVEYFYRNWRRGLFQGREYSIIYSNGVYRDAFTMPSYKNIGPITIRAYVSGSITALNYPSISKIEKYSLTKGANVPMDIDEVVSFEAVFMPALLEGGEYIISGLLQCSSESCRVLIGGREAGGYIAPINMSS